MQIISGFFHGALLDSGIEVRNRENFITLLFITIGNLSNRQIPTSLLIGAPLCVCLITPALESAEGGIKWLNNHFEPLAESALLCSAVALSILGYGTPYGWALTASLAVGIFSRCDFAPRVVGDVFEQLKRLGGFVFLLHPSYLIRLIGVYEIYQQFNKYFEEKGVGGTVSLAQFQRMDDLDLKLSRAHIYTPARLQLDDLPDVNLNGFETLAERMIWHTDVLINSMKSDPKFLDTKGDKSEERMLNYILDSIPKAISYIQALPAREFHLSIKLKHVLKELRNCTTAIQTSVFCQLSRDGLYPLKLVEMVDNLYDLVCVPKLKPKEIPLQTALLDALEKYREKQMEKKITGLGFNLIEEEILALQKIMGQRYLVPKTAPLNFMDLAKKLGQNYDLLQDTDFVNQMKDAYMPYMIEHFDLFLTALSLGDILWGMRDRLQSQRSYYSAGEMYTSYEKNIIAIVQEAIDTTPMLTRARVDAWLADWAAREGDQRQDFYENERLKPKAIALMLIECGIAANV